MLQVVTPARFHDLTLASTLRDELGAAAADAPDEQLERLIRQASGRITRWCNRTTFARERVRQIEHTYTGGYPGRGILLERDLNPSIVSVEEGGSLLTADEWVLDGAMLHRTGHGFRCGWYGPQLTVTYDAGFDLVQDLPGELERACLDLCRAMWHGRGRDPAVRSEQAEGIGAVSYYDPTPGGAGLPPGVTDALFPFRRLSVV